MRDSLFIFLCFYCICAGEYILKGTLEDELPGSACASPLPLGDLPLPEEFLLEDALQDALQLVGLDDDTLQVRFNLI